MADRDLSVKLRIDGDAKGATGALDATGKGLAGVEGAAASAASGTGALGAAAERSAATAVPAHRRVADGIKSISEQLAEVKLLYAGWLAAQQAAGAVAGVAATADAYANLSARIKLAVGDGQAFQQAMSGIQDVALRTNSSLDATGILFTKIVEAGRQMKVSQADALALTETVNQSIQLSGASAQASEAAVTQLIQGLQSGVLRGDEFNSIMEQAPRLARALADGLGVTTGELRKLAEAGQLTAQTVIGALQGQAAAVEREFGQLPATIGRAITNLQTQWQLWIGSLDESTGASRLAAGAIEALADNFDLLASALINAGQAYIGWKAYNIAAEFLALCTATSATTAATVANTAATVANTAVKASNTAAQTANAAAMARLGLVTAEETAATVANTAAKAGAATAAGNAAAGVGRLASALSLVKGFSLAFLLTNLVDIGKWAGEAAAKMMGYGKAMEEAERQMRAQEAAARANAAMNAELAQKQKLAEEAALGLSARSKTLVADFNDMTKDGAAATEALKKLTKALDLSDIQGIADAGAALDALAVKGKISADQVREAWRQALDGQDLRVFEVNALAAFDGSEQGARRLAAALDAQVGEALRRTGLDAGALSLGINQAAVSALNDFDVLAGRLDDLKARGVDTGTALAASLDQAGKAATTEAAVREVIARWEELGRIGQVTGDRLSRGLEQVRRKLDDLRPGVNSLDEAFRQLGMKSPEALRETARAAEEAFNKVREGTVGTREGVALTQEAFRRYAEAAIAANGGVASEALKVQAAMQGLTIETRTTGESIVSAMGRAAGETDRLGRSADGAADKLRRLRQEQGGGDGGDRPPSGGGGSGRGKELSVKEMKALGMSDSEVSNVLSDRQTSDAEKAAGVVKREVNTQSIDHKYLASQQGLFGADAEAFSKRFEETLAREMASFQEKGRSQLVTSSESFMISYAGHFNRAVATAAEQTKRAARATQRSTVEIKLPNGHSGSVDMASDDDAAALTAILRQLESSASRSSLL